MDRSNTRNIILDTALDLFSVNGFEATSISQITDAVGIKKASLYSHFKSKQEILDALVEAISEEYNEHSLFSHFDPEHPDFSHLKQVEPKQLAEMVKGQLRYVLHDPDLKRSRMLLTVEQFRNEELSRIWTDHNYTGILTYHTCLFRHLMEIGVLEEDDPLILAVEYCLPVNQCMNLCDREPEREDEVMDLIERHILHFYKVHEKKK